MAPRGRTRCASRAGTARRRSSSDGDADRTHRRGPGRGDARIVLARTCRGHRGRVRAAERTDSQPQQRSYLMATFAVIAQHPPELCPTSNAQTRQMLKQGAVQIPQLAEQLGVEIITLRIFGPDHIALAVVEAADIETVREFVLQSRLIQWNTTKIHATYSLEEAVELSDIL